MASKVVSRPAARAQLQTGTVVGQVDPNVISRQLSELGDAMETSAQQAQPTRFQGRQSLALGANRVSHGLARKPNGATVTPTVADATFAWALTAADTKTVTITVVGIAMPNAYLEVF